MTKSITAIAALIAGAVALSFATGAEARGGKGSTSSTKGHSGGEHAVHGYTKKDGTHVAPHHATNPNSTKRDNYSSKGNVNPHTGKPGTKDPDKP